MIKFQILGPLVALRDGRSIAITGLNQRAVLGYLLLHANQVVATSELVHALWRDSPPPTARKMLQNAISSLRRALAAGATPDEPPLLITQPPGYLLRVPPADVDLGRFRELVGLGQAALGSRRWDEAEQHLRDALALWRGPALADLAEAGFEWSERIALQNARIAALEYRMDAALAAGRHLEVIDELESLVHGGPIRERLSRQLMLALYRSGRQVDALRLYHRTRTTLVNQLGLDPSPELRELERAILDHDPALHAAADLLIRLPDEAGLMAFGNQPDYPTDQVQPSGEPKPEPPENRMPASEGQHAGAELRWVTAVLVRWETSHPAPPLPLLEEQVAAVERMIRQHVLEHGGQIHAGLGQVHVALFGDAGVPADDAESALRAALAISGQSQPDFQLHVAVASGEGLVRSLDGSQPSMVCGRFLDAGLDLLGTSSTGAVLVCAATQAACADRFNFTPTSNAGYELASPGGWKARAVPSRSDAPAAVLTAAGRFASDPMRAPTVR